MSGELPDWYVKHCEAAAEAQQRFQQQSHELASIVAAGEQVNEYSKRLVASTRDQLARLRRDMESRESGTVADVGITEPIG